MKTYVTCSKCPAREMVEDGDLSRAVSRLRGRCPPSFRSGECGAGYDNRQVALTRGKDGRVEE